MTHNPKFTLHDVFAVVQGARLERAKATTQEMVSPISMLALLDDACDELRLAIGSRDVARIGSHDVARIMNAAADCANYAYLAADRVGAVEGFARRFSGEFTTLFGMPVMTSNDLPEGVIRLVPAAKR